MSERSPRPVGWLVLAAVAALGVCALFAKAATSRYDLAFGLGVPITRVATTVPPGLEACQRDIRVKAPFRGVELTPRVLGPTAPPLSLRVLESDSGGLRGSGRAAAGYPDNRGLVVPISREAIEARGQVDVCILNRGEVTIGLEGGKADAAPTSPLFVGSERVERSALSLRFTTGEPRSVLSQLGVAFERAALFRPSWLGAWTFWLLAGLLVLGVPALLARALADAEAQAGTPSPTPTASGDAGR